MQKINPDILRLRDILRAIGDIETINLSHASSRTDMLATAYTIAIIGEAATRLSQNLKTNHNYIPWQDISSMRNRIIHEYGKVDISLIIEVVKTHIPVLKQQIESIIRNIT
jgi:uncharacterized protein with HEPN domain